MITGENDLSRAGEPMHTVEELIGARSLDLFRAIESQMTDADKRSLLAVQKAVRRAVSAYHYLEIGSHLGGSIQPHMLDPRCLSIISIDPRPAAVKDDRGYDILYKDNSTARMIELLGAVSAEGVSRVRTFDLDASAVPVDAVHPGPHLCFIDGEHSEKAVISDFAFCRSVLAPDGVIVFHDANHIFSGLRKIITSLREASIPFHAYVLPSAVFVMEFGASKICEEDDDIRLLLRDNAEAYLFGMETLLHYREVLNRPALRALRAVWQVYLRVERFFREPRTIP
jgi:hypothetical protein